MNVKAAKIDWAEPPMYLKDGVWHGPPGAMIPCSKGNGIEHLICCPGCGQLTGTKDGAKWHVTKGSLDDVTTLSLQPSHLMGCCGWHGYLTDGEFRKC